MVSVNICLPQKALKTLHPDNAKWPSLPLYKEPPVREAHEKSLRSLYKGSNHYMLSLQYRENSKHTSAKIWGIKICESYQPLVGELVWLPFLNERSIWAL